MHNIQLSITAADPEKLSEFYSSVLGLKITTEDIDGIKIYSTKLDCLSLVMVPNPPGSAASPGVHQFHCTDADTPNIIERAKKYGGKVHALEGNKAAYLIDPAGYPWEITSPDF